MIFPFKKRAEGKRSATKKLATGFTLLYIPNSTDEAKTTEISFDRLVKYIAATIAAVIIIVGLMISMLVHNYRLRQQVAENRESLATLENTNEELKSTIEALNLQIESDREAFSKIEETISAKEDEEKEAKEEAALPAVVPIKGGSAVVVSDPFAGNELLQSYGLVISTSGGALVVATGDGYVEDAKTIETPEGYNSYVFVDHQNGYKSHYRFIGEVSAKAGDTVLREDVLGIMAEDGYLSYEISQDEKFIDPREMIKQ